MRLVVGITGASGAIYGIRLLEALRDANVETHLVLSKWAEATIRLETEYSAAGVKGLASEVHPIGDLAASISSGSFLTDGMVIAPCSMRTVAAIRAGLSDNLLTRAADVTLKEQRRLVLVPRESPLHEIHLENLLALARMRVVIAPPMPAFYTRPQNLDAIINHTVARVLDLLGIDHDLSRRWAGTSGAKGSPQ